MFISLLLTFANLIVVLVGGYYVHKYLQNKAIVMLMLIQSIFYFIKPFAFIVSGVGTSYLDFFINSEPKLNLYLVCGILFNAVFYYCSLYFVRNTKAIDSIVGLITIRNGLYSARLYFVLILFMFISYVFTAIKFHDVLYIFSKKDSFDAMMQLAHGGWFINVLSSIVMVPMLLVLSTKISNKVFTSVFYILVLMVSYYFLTAPSTRTWAISLVLTYYFYIESSIKHKYLLFAGVAIASPVLMFFLNFVRQGIDVKSAVSSTLLESLSGLLINFLQFENSLILMDFFKTNSWLYFKFLLGAITPLVLVPSALIPFKPAADKEAFLTDQIFGDKLNLAFYKENSTLTFSLPISSYSDFGLIGVIVGAIVFAFICSIFFKAISTNDTPMKFIFIGNLLSLSAGYRLGVEGILTSFYVTVFTYLAIKVLLRLRLCDDF